MVIVTKPRCPAINNAAENLKLQILGNEIDVIAKVRYLGVEVDNSMDWKEIITTITSNISRAIGVLKCTEKLLPISSVKTLYAGIVEPNF